MEQNFTCGQSRSHFLRQAKGLPQRAQVFDGRSRFWRIFGIGGCQSGERFQTLTIQISGAEREVRVARTLCVRWPHIRILGSKTIAAIAIPQYDGFGIQPKWYDLRRMKQRSEAVRIGHATVFAACAALWLVGCTSVVVHTYSMPVKQESSEYGKLPDQLPRYTNELSARTQPELFDNDIDFRFEMSNSLNVQDGFSISDVSPDAPLSIVANVGLSKSRAGYRYRLDGALSLPSGEILHPAEVYLERRSSCSTRGGTRSAASIDLRHRDVQVSGEIGSIDEIQESADRVVVRYGCVVFRYDKPVSVFSVFNVNFGNVTTSDARVIPLSVQFYPLVLRFRQK